MRLHATGGRAPQDHHARESFRGSARILLAAFTVVLFAMIALSGTSRAGAMELSSSAGPAPARKVSGTPTPTPEPGQRGSAARKSKKAKSSSSEPPPPPSSAPPPTRPAPVRVVPARPVLPSVPVPPAPTVVSITFDDGLDNQMAGAAVLQQYGLKGTFYINSGLVDSPGHMSLSDLQDLDAAGHEIAGHTTSHVPLTSTPPAEAVRQICLDRATLVGWGFQVRSFAYPFGLFDAAAAQTVQQCGYSNARTTSDLRDPYDPDCAECDLAEPVPPVNPFLVRTPGEVQPNWTAADLERTVVQAAHNGGGWLPFVFHQVCDGCSDISVRAQTLSSFASWLATSAPPGTSVKTVGDVIGGPVRAVESAPAASASRVSNPSLESETPRPPIVNSPGTEDPPDWRPDIPLCWQAGGYGHNTAKFARIRDARSGSWAEQTVVTDYSDGDAKLLTKMDLGECAPNARPGESYILSSWYTSTSPTQYSVYYRTPTGLWKYWTSSPWFDPATQWTQATWATPPAPLEATALSFGLGLASTGSLVTDDYGVVAVSSPGLVTPGGTLLLAITAGILGAILAVSFVQQLRVRAARRRAKAAKRADDAHDETTRIPAHIGGE